VREKITNQQKNVQLWNHLAHYIMGRILTWCNHQQKGHGEERKEEGASM